MRPFTILAKPVSADCNLTCDYCFYLKKSSLYPETKQHRMSDAVLKQFLKTYMQTDQPVYSVCWQGGEPTLLGASFFSKVVDYQQQYGRNGALVSNSVQTNATRITNEMADLFSRYKFLIGCSLDGPQEIHDTYRRRATGKPTHKLVLNGIHTLKQHHTQFNILTLVSRSNVEQGPEIYRYLKKMGFVYQQFIPCVEFDKNGNRLPFAITPDEWGRFLSAVFDQWYPGDIFSVSIRNFDSILSKKASGQNTVCTTGNNCCQYFVVEYNGDVYPCDFFVEKTWKLGNIMNTSWEKMLTSKKYIEFGRQKQNRNKECQSCEYLDLCAGDCLKHRVYSDNPPHNRSWLCSGLKIFFKHTQNRFDDLSDRIRKQDQKMVNDL
jgi:uncharacterized protein